MKKVFKIIRRVLLCLLLACLVFFISNGIVENSKIDQKVEEFMSKGVCESVTKIGMRQVQFCKVSRETYDIGEPEDAGFKPVIIEDGSGYSIGSPGDILLRKKCSYAIPGVNEFITFFFGGHAAIVADDPNKIYESVGNKPDAKDNVVRMIDNTWFEMNEPIYSIRVKGSSDSDVSKALDNVKKRLGEPYNYTFVLGTDVRSYCADLVVKAWVEVDQKYYLNDGFATTINDLLLSENAYLTLYRYCDGNNVHHIYYLV